MRSHRRAFLVVLIVALVCLAKILYDIGFFEGYLDGVEEYQQKNNISTVEYRNFTVLNYLESLQNETVESVELK